MTEWVTHTPDGLRLHIRREQERWTVRCEDGDEIRRELLDVALIEAIRGNQVVAHSTQPWTAHGYGYGLIRSSASFDRWERRWAARSANGGRTTQSDRPASLPVSVSPNQTTEQREGRRPIRGQKLHAELRRSLPHAAHRCWSYSRR
jgi:hypothetical protein